jgi:hypothetical protein
VVRLTAVQNPLAEPRARGSRVGLEVGCERTGQAVRFIVVGLEKDRGWGGGSPRVRRSPKIEVCLISRGVFQKNRSIEKPGEASSYRTKSSLRTLAQIERVVDANVRSGPKRTQVDFGLMAQSGHRLDGKLVSDCNALALNGVALLLRFGYNFFNDPVH